MLTLFSSFLYILQVTRAEVDLREINDAYFKVYIYIYLSIYLSRSLASSFVRLFTSIIVLIIFLFFLFFFSLSLFFFFPYFPSRASIPSFCTADEQHTRISHPRRHESELQRASSQNSGVCAPYSSTAHPHSYRACPAVIRSC